MLTPQQIRDLVQYVRRALARHWRLAGGVAGGILLATLVGAFLLPREYYSEARLFVRFGRENLYLDPTATATNGQMISIYESRESEINSLLEVLKSRAILDRLVESLGPEYVLGGRGEPRPANLGSPDAETASTLSKEPIRPTALHQQAAAALEKNLEIWAPRKSNIITVRCKARTAAAAQQITARLVSIYRDEYVRVHRTAGSYQFFADQTRLSNESWQQAATRFGAAKNKLGIVTIDGKKKLLQDEIADIESKLLGNRSELTAAEAKIASLKDLIAGLPENVLTQQSQAPNAAFDNMRGTLFQLETREQELAARMRDNHPQLVAVRKQLTDLRTVLREQPALRMQATHAVNPSRQALELSLLNEQSQADSLRGRGTSLAALEKQLHGDLKQLNAQEASLGQMEQAVELSASRHRVYADKLEQARINRSLEEERISSLTVVQPASYLNKPTGPRKLYILALGMLLATASGLGTALIAAYFAPTIANGLDLERLLELPVVGMIPSRNYADQGALAT
ncbi:MAG: hypothetical protein WD872_13295 [Pirellulaceae bacterium]